MLLVFVSSHHHCPRADSVPPTPITGSSQAQPVNGALPSLPSPSMQSFSLAGQAGAATPNNQPAGSEAAVFHNGLTTQTFATRKINQLLYNNDNKFLIQHRLIQ